MHQNEQLMDIVKDIAAQSPYIYVVAMNGSRVNTNVGADAWQDYDVVYIVEDVSIFVKDRSWLDFFPKRLIMQVPTDMGSDQPWPTFLMQFENGDRVDLMFVPVTDLATYLQSDSLVKIIMDKEGMLEGYDLQEPNDSKYWIQKATHSDYQDSVNEFLWLSLYVTKGLKRKELLYAIDHLSIMRDELLKMMTWMVGNKTNHKISLGKNHRLLKVFIEEDMWARFMTTYNLSDAELIWDALETLLSLYEIVADRVADNQHFTYDRGQYHAIRNTILALRKDTNLYSIHDIIRDASLEVL